MLETGWCRLYNGSPSAQVWHRSPISVFLPFKFNVQLSLQKWTRKVVGWRNLASLIKTRPQFLVIVSLSFLVQLLSFAKLSHGSPLKYSLLCEYFIYVFRLPFPSRVFYGDFHNSKKHRLVASQHKVYSTMQYIYRDISVCYAAYDPRFDLCEATNVEDL